MPGLLGCTKNKLFNTLAFERALNSMVYDQSYEKDDIYEDSGIIASRTHLNVIGEKSSPYCTNNFLVWVEGEIYNLLDLSIKFKKSYECFPEALVDATSRGILSEFCSYINGYFVAVVYNISNSEIFIISDRYGLKPIYIFNKAAGALAWASELKCFKFIFKEVPTINTELIDVFLELGHFTGSSTWFKDIILADAATIYKFNLIKQTRSVERYWTWTKVQPLKISFNEAVDNLNNLLVKSVNRCNDVNLKTGLTLSGGTDSRVILSLLKSPCSVETLTWGIPESIDVMLAKKVAKLKGCRHTFLEMASANWFAGRELGVWKTDGMFNLMHMHSSSFHPAIKELFDINLNGFAGDLNIGGGWITLPNSRITSEVAQKKLREGSKLAPYTDSFYDICHEDPYFLDTRVRRFTNSGSIEHAKLIEQRKPFYDNSIMEFVYGLPDEYRLNSKLYNTCIVKHFPDLFRNIHTTHGIVPLGRTNNLSFRLQTKIKNIPIKLKLQKEPVWSYHNYGEWIKDFNFSKYLLKTLDPKTAHYTFFTKRNLLEEFVVPHLEGKGDFSESILASLTMELWFKQVL